MVNYMQLSVYGRCKRLWGESEKGLTFLDGKSVGPVCVGETDARRLAFFSVSLSVFLTRVQHMLASFHVFNLQAQ